MKASRRNRTFPLTARLIQCRSARWAAVAIAANCLPSKCCAGSFALLRTHTCGQLRTEHIGQEVTLCGWVDTNRDQGGIVFIDLRDRYGKTQVVFDPEGGPDVLAQASKLRTEDVVRVTGKVDHRPEGTTNPKLGTGEIEVRAKKLELLNKC